jgi:polyvinyl alcohol dehydrogenase (cytochrome)
MLKPRYWQFKVRCLLVLAALVAISASTLLAIHAQGTSSTNGDWPTYLENNARTGYNSAETTINATTVPNLKLKWTYPAGHDISVQPVVANGQVYFGSWDGNEYATDLAGKKIWSASIGGQTPDCQPPTIFGVASTATIADVSIQGANTSVVFVGGKDASKKVASMYALNAATGAVLWQTPLSSSTASFSWSSPAVYNGSVYVGLASVNDCPIIPGALFQLDATTGTILHKFSVVPSGCAGGTIWSSPAIDEATDTIYLSTGNSAGSCSQKEKYAQAIVKLKASDLSFLDAWQVPASQHGIDSDFGATPTLFTATYAGSTHALVGAVNKNGNFYALDRTSLSHGPVWTAKTSTSTISISSSAWDGTQLYIAGRTTSIGGTSCKGSLRAVNPATGQFIWQDCLKDGGVLGPVSAVSGVVFVGEGSHLLAMNAATGRILFNYTTSAGIQGGASISNGVVYLGNSAGTLYAFGL